MTVMDNSLINLKYDGGEQVLRKKDGFESERILVQSRHLQERYAQDPLAQQLYVTDIGYYPDAQYHYRERPHGCEEYILILCVNGEGWFDNGGTQAKVIRKYDVLILPPYSPHQYGASSERPWSIHWVHYKGRLADSYYRMFALTDYTLQMAQADALHMVSLFESCYSLLSEKSFSLPHHLYAHLYLQQMLSTVAMQTRLASDQAANDYVEQSISFMRQRMNENLTLEQLAAYVNLSRSHYLAVFKSMTGYSPMQYFNQLKIRQASTYLDLTDWTVKEISNKLGFQDALYFSRVFRKIMGMSPTHYRERKKG